MTLTCVRRLILVLSNARSITIHNLFSDTPIKISKNRIKYRRSGNRNMKELQRCVLPFSHSPSSAQPTRVTLQRVHGNFLQSRGHRLRYSKEPRARPRTFSSFLYLWWNSLCPDRFPCVTGITS